MRLSITTYVLAVAMTLSSCQTVNNILGRETVTQGTEKTGGEKKRSRFQLTNRGKKKNRAEVDTVPENPVTVCKPERGFSKSDSLRAVKQLAGEWYFDTVSGVKVYGEENRPTLEFGEDSPRFYATNGCNLFNGMYRLSGQGVIGFTDVVSTLNLCDDTPWGSTIAVMWPDVRFWSYRGAKTAGAEDYLDLKDSGSRVIATLKRHSMTSLNGLWSVVDINGMSIIGESPVIVIDLRERRVHGNTGCNLFNGDIYQNPDVECSVQFQNMAVTKMSCPGVAVETAFLVAMEQVEKAVLSGAESAVLTDASGRQLIKLERVMQ